MDRIRVRSADDSPVFRGGLRTPPSRRGARGGEAISGPDVAKRMIEYANSPQSSRAAQAFPALIEREVLELVVRGHDNAWMARHVVRSRRTTRNHVSHAFAKPRVADRAQALVRAREAGKARPWTKL